MTPQATEVVPVILPWDQLQKLAERDGLDIMVYVNSMNAHIEHQRAALRQQAEQIKRLAAEVASWKAVAHDHSGRLAIQEVNLLAFRRIEHERDAAIKDVARLHAGLLTIATGGAKWPVGHAALILYGEEPTPPDVPDVEHPLENN